ncbi:MAG: PIN domain-containing protein [Luteibacter sp.]
MPRIAIEDFTHDFVAANVDAVCVDTSTYERLDFAFGTNVLGRLSSLKDAHITLLMVDLIEREVISHLTQKAQDNVAGLRRAMRSARNHGLVDENVIAAYDFADFDATQHARDHLDAFIADSGAEVIKAADHTNVQRLIEDYFEQRPPFGDKKKKNEFPDALALGALEQWAKNAGKRVLVVSHDNDWMTFAEASDQLLCGPTLTDLLAKLPHGDKVMLARAGRAAAGVHFAAIRNALARDVRGLGIEAGAEADMYVEIDVLDSGLVSLPIPRPDGESFELMASGPDELVVRWSPEVVVWVEASAHFHVRDPYDRDFVRLPGMLVRRESEVAIEVLLIFDVIEGDGVQSIEFSSADVVDDEIHIDLGHLTPDLSGT